MSAAPRTILSVFATFAVGGPQVRFAALANRYGARYRHLIVAMDGNTACRERLSPSLDLSFPAVPIRKGATLANLRVFRRFLRTLAPDVLVTNNWGSIEWAMANLPALVRHVHIEDGFGPEERDTQIRRRVLTRRLVLRWSTVALPSQTLTRIAIGTWGLDPRRVRSSKGFELCCIDDYTVEYRAGEQFFVFRGVPGTIDGTHTFRMRPAALSSLPGDDRNLLLANFVAGMAFQGISVRY